MMLSIAIPCYNESENIKYIIEQLKQAIGDRRDVEVILVDNGSTDGSSEVFKKELATADSRIFKICEVKINRGYGFGIQSGLGMARGDILSWTHADMQTDPADVLKAYDVIRGCENKNIVVKGKRKNRRIAERFFTFGMQIAAFMFLNVYLDDINAQPKAFTRDFYEKYIKNGAPYDFSLDLFLLYMAKLSGYEIISIPVFFNKRLYGQAKGGGSMKTRIKLIRRTFKYIHELSKKSIPENK